MGVNPPERNKDMRFSKGNGDGKSFEEKMNKALGQSKEQVVADAAGKVVGVFSGFLFTTFFVPFVAVYAYNGMQPAVWPDISYLPTLAGFFVFRQIIHMLRSE